ncbi:hypothetical protein MKZ38_004359 [Zalerion maritima]|uniref:GPI transamidase component GAA1 n=1 Tax=Zalerion maritima TaxID=339359 RepID=A0AAD5WRP6_9PEZI|nr:hypothetical protein MKZ38_004359 [Zalerion maritima]
MPSLLSSAFSLRRDPRILKIPPYLSLVCIVVGVVWLFLLPLDDYSRRTYISENALLPGQVHTYFGGSDQNVFRAYKNEVVASDIAEANNTEVNDKLEGILKGVGLKTGRQSFKYESRSWGDEYEGENLYAILQAPRGDATEAIVLVAPFRTVDGKLNANGVALALTLSRYFKRWSLWSKDIIILLPPDSLAGPQAWVDAYHDAHNPSTVSSLPLKSGALQGAIALDYTHEGRFEAVHIVYDGVNGQLPNLDLINAVSNIAGGQMGMGTALQHMYRHKNNYSDRLQTMLRGMLNQALGRATGAHSCFIPYHVDAITLQPFSANPGSGWHDEMALGRLVEGSFRSLNNLLEHLHQSFFFYLLMHRDRFVSIGTYLPSAMVLAANFTIMAIFMWVKSGQPQPGTKTTEEETTEGDGDKKKPAAHAVERELFLPLGLVTAVQFLGVVPLFLFNHAPASTLSPLFILITLLSPLLPIGINFALPSLSQTGRLTPQHYQLFHSFSLLLLGMFLSTLATLNFSLAFVVGIFSAPLTFVRPVQNVAVKLLSAVVLNALAPTTVILAASFYVGMDISDVLREAAFGWEVWGMYTSVIVWCVWWPAWIIGATVLLGNQSIAKEKTL